MKIQLGMLSAIILMGGPCLADESHGIDTTPVQWTIEEGGNGHWYLFVEGDCNQSISVDDLITASNSIGGHLATFTDIGEWNFVRLAHGGLLIGDPCTADWFIGLTSAPGSNDWQWVTGESFTFNAWGTSACGAGPYPNNVPYSTLAYVSNRSDCGQVWDDGIYGSISRNFMVEFSADCNGDGIVDYGQILDGTYADIDGNGIPDCCEDEASCELCIADVYPDGTIDISDLLIVIAYYGLLEPAAGDINLDGQVDSEDILGVLDQWGDCNAP